MEIIKLPEDAIENIRKEFRFNLINVVKELVFNSIDAKATKINIYLLKNESDLEPAESLLIESFAKRSARTNRGKNTDKNAIIGTDVNEIKENKIYANRFGKNNGKRESFVDEIYDDIDSDDDIDNDDIDNDDIDNDDNCTNIQTSNTTSNTTSNLTKSETNSKNKKGTNDIDKKHLDANKSIKFSKSFSDKLNCGAGTILVNDNGAGMSKKDLLICADKYTTSRYPSTNNLSSKELGFATGLGLYNISSHAKLSISTRSMTEIFGCNLVLDKSKKYVEQSCRESVGTSVSVQNFTSKFIDFEYFALRLLLANVLITNKSLSICLSISDTHTFHVIENSSSREINYVMLPDIMDYWVYKEKHPELFKQSEHLLDRKFFFRIYASSYDELSGIPFDTSSESFPDAWVNESFASRRHIDSKYHQYLFAQSGFSSIQNKVQSNNQDTVYSHDNHNYNQGNNHINYNASFQNSTLEQFKMMISEFEANLESQMLNEAISLNNNNCLANSGHGNNLDFVKHFFFDHKKEQEACKVNNDQRSSSTDTRNSQILIFGINNHYFLKKTMSNGLVEIIDAAKLYKSYIYLQLMQIIQCRSNISTDLQEIRYTLDTSKKQSKFLEKFLPTIFLRINILSKFNDNVLTLTSYPNVHIFKNPRAFKSALSIIFDLIFNFNDVKFSEQSLSYIQSKTKSLKPDKSFSEQEIFEYLKELNRYQDAPLLQFSWQLFDKDFEWLIRTKSSFH